MTATTETLKGTEYALSAWAQLESGDISPRAFVFIVQCVRAHAASEFAAAALSVWRSLNAIA